MNEHIQNQTATVEFADFEKAISRAVRTVEKRSSYPILHNVRIAADGGIIRLETNNPDLTCVTLAPAETPFSFETTVEAHRLAELVKKSKKAANSRPVSLHFNGVELTVNIADISVELPTLPASDFPETPFESDRDAWTLSTDELRGALDSCAPCMSNEETRYYLCGVFFHVDGDVLRLVSTDGHKLAAVEIARPEGLAIEHDKSGGFIVPAATVTELRDALKKTKAENVTCKLSNNESRVQIQIGPNLIFFARKIDGTFPAYQRVIPAACDNTAIFDRKELISRLNQIDAAGATRTDTGTGKPCKPVKITVENGFATLSARTDYGAVDAIKSAMQIDACGTIPVFALNLDYLKKIAETAVGETLSINLQDEMSPIRIRGVSDVGRPDKALFVIVPVRVDRV